MFSPFFVLLSTDKQTDRLMECVASSRVVGGLTSVVNQCKSLEIGRPETAIARSIEREG